jgi:hypothetical protein
MDEILERIVRAHHAVEHDEDCHFCGANWRDESKGTRVREHASDCEYAAFMDALGKAEL